MSTNDSTAHARTDKPAKPRPDFPLFPHASGRWAKKIRGKVHYFGYWNTEKGPDPESALAKYNAVKDDLHAGRKPREVVSEGVTVKLVANAFLTHKKALLNAGELSQRTWLNYEETAEMVIRQFGSNRLAADLGPDDFAKLRDHMTGKWGPVRVRNYIQQVRSIFKYGFDAELLKLPLRFGPGFKRPSKKTVRIAKAEKGAKMFEADEVRALVDGALVVGATGPELVRPTPILRAMILLGVNCGFGNTDCGTLPESALDLAGGWVSYHRPKTGITRRCPLWPETVEALRTVLSDRSEELDDKVKGLVFVTKYGLSWARYTGDNPLSKETKKLMNALGLNGHRNYYALRHTFETIGGEAKDQVAVDAVMGHVRDDMASQYRERISDARLKAVSDHVRNWVWPDRVG
jgi:integrase